MITVSQAVSELRTSHKDGRLVPFIGAGFSDPLDLPDWKNLVSEAAKKIGFEPDLFFLHGTYPQLLEYIKEFYEQEWVEFLHNMAVQFDSQEVNEKRKSSITHKAMSNLDLKSIYTTNYDSHIEKALEDVGKKPYVIATLDDFVRPIDKPIDCQIIKFHGTLLRDETMVLTESQYFERMSLEEAVDQRLRSDILSNNFLFIGYSFSDPNIRYIWYRIHKLKILQKKLSLRRCYYITFGNEPVQSKLLENWNIHVISLDAENRSKSLFEFLDKIR
jgi:hypothetical protein